MKFSEMPYTRPNAAQTVERYRDMARRAEAAASGKELVDLFRLHTQLDDGFATAYRLAQIRHTLDTRDEFYDGENDFFDNAAPEVSNAQLAFYRAVLGNEHKQALAEAYAPILLDKMELAVSAASDEVLDLMQQENALASRYQKIKAGAQVEFDGKTLTLPGLDPYKQSLDRAVRKAAFEAEGGFYDRRSKTATPRPANWATTATWTSPTSGWAAWATAPKRWPASGTRWRSTSPPWPTKP